MKRRGIGSGAFPIAVVGVVATPGSGRVTLIHANGNQSKIASPELPYLVSKPINWAKGE